MKISIFAAGSRGDIQPCLALGKGLQAAGYQVKLAIPSNFADFVQEHGIEPHALRGDVQKVMSGDTGRDFLEKGGANPLLSIMAMRKMIATVVMEMADDALEASRDSDCLICLGVFSPFGTSIGEALRIPVMNIEPTPLLPTRDFPAPSWPIQRNLGGWHNRLSGMAMLYSIWLWYAPFVRDFRRKLGLPSASAGYFYRSLRSTPMIGAYSPILIPKPMDWPETLHITGSLFLDNNATWQPPADLQKFLDEGDPPVYLGFGSMTGANPEELAGVILEAVENSDQRAVLLTGWSGMKDLIRTDRVHVMESAPHSWLFPRMAAVVHHGGSGTIAEGLRAGVPNVIIPFAFDQFFWGERIHSMGLGPAPQPRKKLTASRLAGAIRLAVSDPGMRLKAADCGKAIQTENSLKSAVDTVSRYIGEPR